MSGDKLFSIYPETPERKKKASAEDSAAIGERSFDVIIHYKEFVSLPFLKVFRSCTEQRFTMFKISNSGES